MSLYAKLATSSASSPFAANSLSLVPIHVSELTTINIQQIVEQLTPHLAQSPVNTLQLPAEAVQSLNLQEMIVAQMLIQSGSQIPGILQPPATVDQPRLNPNPPPPPHPPCIALPNLATTYADEAAACVPTCQGDQATATAAVQAAAAATDCATRLQQANQALSALNALDSSAEEASSRVQGITYLASLATQGLCGPAVYSSIAAARARAQASYGQANQIASSSATTLLLASAQHWQSVALAECGPQPGPVTGPPPQCINPVVMWYGMNFELDETCTTGLESLCDLVGKGGGITGAILNTLKTAIVGSNPLAGTVLTAMVTVSSLLLEQAMKNADHGAGTTIHVSFVPILGLSFVLGPTAIESLEALLEAGTLGIGVGGNPLLTVLWVTGN
jgi:hypothetical protein